MYIPNNAVGAIIGTKGLHIRNIIRFSNASVKIAPLEQDKQGENQSNPQQERKVTIVGSPEAQWKVCTLTLDYLFLSDVFRPQRSTVYHVWHYFYRLSISSSRRCEKKVSCQALMTCGLQWR